MNFFSPTDITKLLNTHNAKPLKGLGQNFLIDKNVLEKIIAAADIQPADTIVEVGPGIGTLTQALAQKAKKVIAIEKDRNMRDILGDTLKEYSNVEIVHADILNYKLKAISYKLVANLPYYITSPVIRKFLEEENAPKSMILMVQKEVAQRICAAPPHMSLLAVSIQLYARPEIVSYVSKSCFWPAPTIDSAVIKIMKHETYAMEHKEREKFFNVVKAGFGHPRKQLVNNLATFVGPNGVQLEKYAAAQWLVRCGIEGRRRPETLTINEWISLVRGL